MPRHQYLAGSNYGLAAQGINNRSSTTVGASSQWSFPWTRGQNADQIAVTVRPSGLRAQDAAGTADGYLLVPGVQTSQGPQQNDTSTVGRQVMPPDAVHAHVAAAQPPGPDVGWRYYAPGASNRSSVMVLADEQSLEMPVKEKTKELVKQLYQRLGLIPRRDPAPGHRSNGLSVVVAKGRPTSAKGHTSQPHTSQPHTSQPHTSQPHADVSSWYPQSLLPYRQPTPPRESVQSPVMTEAWRPKGSLRPQHELRVRVYPVGSDCSHAEQQRGAGRHWVPSGREFMEKQHRQALIQPVKPSSTGGSHAARSWSAPPAKSSRSSQVTSLQKHPAAAPLQHRKQSRSKAARPATATVTGVRAGRPGAAQSGMSRPAGHRRAAGPSKAADRPAARGTASSSNSPGVVPAAEELLRRPRPPREPLPELPTTLFFAKRQSSAGDGTGAPVLAQPPAAPVLPASVATTASGAQQAVANKQDISTTRVPKITPLASAPAGAFMPGSSNSQQLQHASQLALRPSHQSHPPAQQQGQRPTVTDDSSDHGISFPATSTSARAVPAAAPASYDPLLDTLISWLPPRAESSNTEQLSSNAEQPHHPAGLLASTADRNAARPHPVSLLPHSQGSAGNTGLGRSQQREQWLPSTGSSGAGPAFISTTLGAGLSTTFGTGPPATLSTGASTVLNTGSSARQPATSLPQHHTKASFPSAGPAAIIPTSLAPATSQQGDSFLSTSAMAQALPHSYTSAAESQAGTPSWLDATLLAHGLPMPAATTVTQGQSGSPRASALSGASGVSLPADLEELERMVARLDQQLLSSGMLPPLSLSSSPASGVADQGASTSAVDVDSGDDTSSTAWSWEQELAALGILSH